MAAAMDSSGTPSLRKRSSIACVLNMVGTSRASKLDNEDGVHGDGMGGKKGDIEIAESMWTAARRILAAMQMLMMALDVDIDDRDWLGRPNSLPNIMNGAGMDDAEYDILKSQGLLTDREVRAIKAYPGFKCQVPIKWALNELRDLCKPEDRTKNQAKNYEAMQEIAANFNKVRAMRPDRCRQRAERLRSPLTRLRAPDGRRRSLS